MTDKIKIHILHCGRVEVDSALPFKGHSLNPIAYTGILRSKKHQIWLPVSTYLIEHPKGLVLIDTGWHTDVRTDQKKYLGLLHYQINKADLPEGQAIHEQLDKLGFKPEDIDYLIFSHLHSDHVSGLKLVSKAKKILVHNLEIQDTINHKIRYIAAMWKGVSMEEFKLQDSNYGPQNKSFDLFNDDSIIFIHTPGHTNGLLSTLIKNNGKEVLLASDTGYAKKSWQKMLLPGVMSNKKNCIESLAWVKEYSKNKNLIEVVANHDYDIKPHVIEL